MEDQTQNFRVLWILSITFLTIAIFECINFFISLNMKSIIILSIVSNVLSLLILFLNKSLKPENYSSGSKIYSKLYT